jgi:CRISPR-associated protein Cas2
MLMLSYDITDNKTRTRFSKFLSKYGRRLQFSVFEIKNSNRVLEKILVEIELKYKKKFKISDSILIWQLTENEEKRIIRYGYSVHEEKSLVMF